MAMAWITLFIASACETIFALSVKLADGFNNPKMLVLTAIGGIGGYLLLTLATQTLPISIAYPVWTASSIVGVVVFGVLFLGENVTAFKTLSIALIIAGVAGLKASG
jgi:quaternary ammonium compound-resistance protein SugE